MNRHYIYDPHKDFITPEPGLPQTQAKIFAVNHLFILLIALQSLQTTQSNFVLREHNMPTKRLQHLLGQLNEEIESLGASNPAETLKLERLVAEIELALENEQSEAYEPLMDSIRSSLLEFEAEHPTASGIARRLMQALGDMGI